MFSNKVRRGVVAVAMVLLTLPLFASPAAARIKIDWTHPDGCSTRMCITVNNGPTHCAEVHIYMFCSAPTLPPATPPKQPQISKGAPVGPDPDR
jgi:hypothetical protein